MMNNQLKDTLRVFVVPTEILDVEGLTANEKLVYMVLRSYANGQNDSVFPSLNTIASKSSLTKPTVIKCLQRLEEMGLLIKEIRKKWKNGIIINDSNLYHIIRPAEIGLGVVKSFNQGSKMNLPGWSNDFTRVVKEVYQGGKVALPEKTKEKTNENNIIINKEKNLEKYQNEIPTVTYPNRKQEPKREPIPFYNWLDS